MCCGRKYIPADKMIVNIPICRLKNDFIFNCICTYICCIYMTAVQFIRYIVSNYVPFGIYSNIALSFTYKFCRFNFSYFFFGIISGMHISNMTEIPAYKIIAFTRIRIMQGHIGRSNIISFRICIGIYRHGSSLSFMQDIINFPILRNFPFGIECFSFCRTFFNLFYAYSLKFGIIIPAFKFITELIGRF